VHLSTHATTCLIASVLARSSKRWVQCPCIAPLRLRQTGVSRGIGVDRTGGVRRAPHPTGSWTRKRAEPLLQPDRIEVQGLGPWRVWAEPNLASLMSATARYLFPPGTRCRNASASVTSCRRIALACVRGPASCSAIASSWAFCRLSQKPGLAAKWQANNIKPRRQTHALRLDHPPSVRSWRYLPSFLVWALRASLQARSARGSLAVAVFAEARRTFWTRTVWTDEAALRAYMVAGAHLRVMPRLLAWCDEAAVAHWTQATAEPPSWQEAHQRLQRDGRTSKLNHPSEAHRRFEVPAPVVARRRELRFKRGA